MVKPKIKNMTRVLLKHRYKVQELVWMKGGLGTVVVFNCDGVNSILGALSQLGDDKGTEPYPK